MDVRPIIEGTGNMKAARAVVEVRGVVQGVGFRPFLQRLACELGLTGYVENREYGVKAEVFGPRHCLDLFLQRVEHTSPPGASIFQVHGTISAAAETPPAAFVIRASRKKGAISTFVPPDLAICPRCLREIEDPGNRRYRYPFATCNDCGPRFTLLRSLPYDRRETAMSRFPLCPDCRTEYESPGCRRCHAQIISCPRDGPVLTLWEGNEAAVTGNEEALRRTIEHLGNGAVVALKGIGGFHLACLAENEQSVQDLRRLKNRPAKPLALMARDCEIVAQYASFGHEEARLLDGPASPIVVLAKRNPDRLPGIAPGLDTLGFMLPYTPLHRLILAELPLLVMTSGNLEGEAIVKDNNEARGQLSRITPYFLVHDREILHRCEDSLVRVVDGQPVFLRRARGYVPLPIEIGATGGHRPVLATGGDLKACFGLSKGGFVWLSQYLGDLERPSNHEAFRESLAWFTRAFEIEPERVVTDLHPGYFSRGIGEEYAARHDLPCHYLQHHKAHIYSVMAENGLTEAIGVAFDGTGYGEDGRIWGGEFFLIRGGREERLAHLDYLPLPGGERGIAEPIRMTLSHLYRTYGDGWRRHLPGGITPDRAESLVEVLSHGRDLVYTSSMGRLFDAVAALLGVCDRQRYDGEAASLLEAAAGTATEERYPWSLAADGPPWAIEVEKTIGCIVDDLERGRSVSEIARVFHNTIVEITVTVVKAIGDDRGERAVCLSGGVFQNRILFALTRQRLLAEGFTPFVNRRVPPNDGGIALGQVYGLLRREGD